MATFVLLMLLLVALYLRVSHLGTENLWLDEAISVGIAKNSLGQVLSLSLDDFNPPLYRLLLHCWMWFFGAFGANALGHLRRLFGSRAL